MSLRNHGCRICRRPRRRDDRRRIGLRIRRRFHNSGIDRLRRRNHASLPIASSARRSDRPWGRSSRTSASTIRCGRRKRSLAPRGSDRGQRHRKREPDQRRGVKSALSPSRYRFAPVAHGLAQLSTNARKINRPGRSTVPSPPTRYSGRGTGTLQ